jgi:site-specific recombinase XerD
VKPRLPRESTDALRRQLDEFLTRLEERGYAENAKKTYDQNVDRFIRWLEGSWEPEGPRR